MLFSIVSIAFMLYGSLALYANDAAVETAAGGIVLKKEPRISMEKERLAISLSKVTVEYEFLNESDKDITTQVAFPIPEYQYQFEDPAGKRDFSDFSVRIDGKPIKFEKIIRAFADGKDYTDLLTKLGISIETFGNFDANDADEHPKLKNGKFRYDVENLTKSQQTDLMKRGLIDKEGMIPLWKIQKSYYWTQVFPSRKIIRIEHQYKPVAGMRFVPVKEFQKELKDGCIEDSLFSQLKKNHTDGGMGTYIHANWVKYILTTANTWKTPIKSFELIIDKSLFPDYMDKPKFISFCWEGKVEKLDNNRYMARETNFVPSSELTIYFF